MFEVAVWLIVTLYSPDQPKGQTVFRHEYTVLADHPEKAAEDCAADALQWLKYAVHVNRGNWRLEPSCFVQHDDAEPAKAR